MVQLSYKRAEPHGHGISDLTGWETLHGYRQSFPTKADDASLAYAYAYTIQRCKVTESSFPSEAVFDLQRVGPAPTLLNSSERRRSVPELNIS